MQRCHPLSRLFSIYGTCCTWWCSKKEGQAVQAVCHMKGWFVHRRTWWTDEQQKKKKQTKQLGCETESKNSWRLTSRSTESSLTWIHSDRAGAQNCTEALSCELIVAMPSIIQSVSLFPTLYWPDPLVPLPRWSPADSGDHRTPRCFVSARYAFTVTTGDILSPHIYVSQLKPAPRRQAQSVSRLCRSIWVYLSLCVSEDRNQVHRGCLSGTKSRKSTLSASEPDQAN